MVPLSCDQAMNSWSKDAATRRHPTTQVKLLGRFRRHLFRQPVEMHADMRRLRRGVGQRNGAIEHSPAPRSSRPSCSSRPPFTPRNRSSPPSRSASGSIIASAASGPLVFDTATARLSVTTGDGWMLLERWHRAHRSAPSRCPRRAAPAHATPQSPPAPDRHPAAGGASPCRSAPRLRRSSRDSTGCDPDRPAARSALGVEPRRRPRMLQQHQRHKPHDLGLGRKYPLQQPAQTNGFVAQRRARICASPPLAE